MNDGQSHAVDPGDEINLVNKQSKAIRVTIALQDGTRFEVDLHPGARIGGVVGSQPINLIIDDAEGPQHIRPAD